MSHSSSLLLLLYIQSIIEFFDAFFMQKYRIRLRLEKEKRESNLYCNKFHRTMMPSYQAGYMGMGPNNISGPSSNPLLVPQAATYTTWVKVPGTGNAVLGSFSGSVPTWVKVPNNISGPSSNPVLVPQAATYTTWVEVPRTGNAMLGSFSGSVPTWVNVPVTGNAMLGSFSGSVPTWVNVPGTGNAMLGSFSGSVQPQQVGACAQQYYNNNCFPNTAFGTTDVGINAQTFSANPAQDIREENTDPKTVFASFNDNFQAPGTSTPGCHAAGGLAPAGLLMDSNQSLLTNMGQENHGVHEAAATSSAPMEDEDIDKVLEEFFKEGGW